MVDDYTHEGVRELNILADIELAGYLPLHYGYKLRRADIKDYKLLLFKPQCSERKIPHRFPLSLFLGPKTNYDRKPPIQIAEIEDYHKNDWEVKVFGASHIEEVKGLLSKLEETHKIFTNVNLENERALKIRYPYCGDRIRSPDIPPVTRQMVIEQGRLSKKEITSAI